MIGTKNACQNVQVCGEGFRGAKTRLCRRTLEGLQMQEVKHSTLQLVLSVSNQSARDFPMAQ